MHANARKKPGNWPWWKHNATEGADRDIEKCLFKLKEEAVDVVLEPLRETEDMRKYEIRGLSRGHVVKRHCAHCETEHWFMAMTQGEANIWIGWAVACPADLERRANGDKGFQWSQYLDRDHPNGE